MTGTNTETSAATLTRGLRSFALTLAVMTVAGAMWPVHELHAQTAKAPKKSAAKESAAGDSTQRVKHSKLFKSETPLAVTLTANFKQLRKERRDGAPWHAASLSYRDSAGRTVQIPLRVRTRGIWRLNNCDFPPLRMNFAGKTTKGTLFDDLDEPKLVSFCRNGANAEPYVLQEHQLYRIYRQLTPISHETRLLTVTYVDSATGATEFTRYAFVVEDPARMAQRNGGRILEQQGARPDDLEPDQAAIAFLFQYMIGNSDYSFNTLHNGQLLVRSGDPLVIPIPYDFDFAGAIDAPYAVSAPGMRSKRVRDRQFTGHCAIRAHYPAAAALFLSKREQIYALYSDSIGRLLAPETVKATLGYYDDFYRDIATPKELERRVVSDCSDQR